VTADAASRAVAGRGSQFAELSRLVHSAGLMRRRPRWYAVAVGLNLALLAGGWVAFALLGRTWWQLLVAVFLAVMTTQTAFLGHDAGHHQISGSRRISELIGRLHGNLLTGLGWSWWISKHNRHHAHPNQVGRDPDIDSKALAFTADQARARRGAGAGAARWQAWLFFPMLLLEGINLQANGIASVLGRRRAGKPWKAEAGLIAVHHAAYLGALFAVLAPGQALAFIAVHQGLFGLYVGSSFAPNHKGMPILAAGERPDFLRAQVLTSRNIRGGWLTDIALGGLNYQIEHHLFPSMPRPALRGAQPLVRAFCAEHGVSYCETGLVASYALVLRHLDDAGNPSRGSGPGSALSHG
jgi:fatty acid desaturase